MRSWSRWIRLSCAANHRPALPLAKSANFASVTMSKGGRGTSRKNIPRIFTTLLFIENKNLGELLAIRICAFGSRSHRLAAVRNYGVTRGLVRPTGFFAFVGQAVGIHLLNRNRVVLGIACYRHVLAVV